MSFAGGGGPTCDGLHQRGTKGAKMTTVRALVGTRKGAFILTSDGKRERWDVDGPHWGGGEISPRRGSPADPSRLYAAQSTGWFGQLIQRSDDGGRTWRTMGNEFTYDGVPGTHQWYDGTPHPWEFARVWHLEPAPADPDTIYAGVEDAALFRSADGGATWQELPGLRAHHRAGPRRGGADVRGHLGGRRLPYRRRGQDLAGGEPRPAFGGHPGSGRRRRSLRAPHRHAPVTGCGAVHAKPLRSHAQPRR